MRALGIDVGGTFTDAVLVADGEVADSRRCRRSAPGGVRARGRDGGRAPTTSSASRTARRSRRTRCSSGAARGRRSSRRRASSTSSTSGARRARTCTGPAPSTRSRSSRSSAASASAGGIGPDGELEPLDLATLPGARRRRDRRLPPLRVPRRPPRARRSPPSCAAAIRDAHVVASHEVAPEFREYERASTTVVDAYLGPVLSPLPPRARRRPAAAQGLPEPLVMRSSGGLATLEEAAAHAAFALLSGPAAGVVGAARIAALAGFPNALSFDMGGTSTDVCAIVDGEARREHEREVGGFPVRLPTLAVHTVGAGGGSIVWRDAGGALRVGPESAGADPGPACYGRGGDAADGDRREPAARPAPGHAPRRHRARRRRRSARASATSIRRPSIAVVNAEMMRALRVVSVEQGLDPRDFALVAFGGAGPLHACALADELGDARRCSCRPRRACSPRSASSPRTSGATPCARTSSPLAGGRRAAGGGRGRPPLRGPVVRADGPARPTARRALPRGARGALRLRRSRRARSSSSRSARRRSAPAPPLEVTGPELAARGPQVLELEGATAWVPEGWAGETDAHGTLVLAEDRRDPGRAPGARQRAPRDRRGDGRRARPLRVLGEHQGAPRLLDRALRRGGPDGHAGRAHPGPPRRDAGGGRRRPRARPRAGRAVDPQRPVRGRDAPPRPHDRHPHGARLRGHARAPRRRRRLGAREPARPARRRSRRRAS